ncbi:hypothetical protein, partial [Rhizobium skierniewicense]|uniref:hypothetical protein n=1 Tax=Rhizobium skierniewicense TaxID=984260 RepID=UPI001AEE37CE
MDRNAELTALFFPARKIISNEINSLTKNRKKQQKTRRSFLHGVRIARTLVPFRPRIHRKALRRGGTGAGGEGVRNPSS